MSKCFKVAWQQSFFGQVMCAEVFESFRYLSRAFIINRRKKRINSLIQGAHFITCVHYCHARKRVLFLDNKEKLI